MDDKSCCCNSGGESSSTTSTSTSSSGNRDQYLKQINKLSHKITKPPTTCNPIIKKPNAFDLQNQPPQPQPQPQPPVYNINKNDFRLVVQKLTGSPAHNRFSTPPPKQQPKPPSSRLQRIRPPPLAHVTNRPSPVLSCAPPPVPPPNPAAAAYAATASQNNNNNSSGKFVHLLSAPLSPLPPLPAVHAAAESPISAYMRYLQNSFSSADPNSKTPQFSGFSPLAPLVSPRWNNSTDTSQKQGVMAPPSSQQQMPELQSQFPFPSSPLPYGCLNSPRSPYALLSPSLLFSPTSGQLNFPLSPTVPVPVPSPRWRSL